MSEELAKYETPQTVVTRSVSRADLAELGEQVKVLHEFVKAHLREGIDYGTIPGAGQRKVLLKPGAERILLLFRCTPRFALSERDLGDGHLEVLVSCTAVRLLDGAVIAEGNGSCSTRERKYAYYKDGQERNPWDSRNVVLKMAKKRAEVDCSLNLSGLSDAFTQDVEEEEHRPGPKPNGAPQPQPTSPSASATERDEPLPGDENEESGNTAESPVIPFGKNKGTPLSKLSQTQLGWYAEWYEKAILDPSKEQYKATNSQMLDAITSEMVRGRP